jgi:hypothetical protein
MKQLKYLMLTISVLAVFGCVRTTYLKNGHTHVATNPKVYKNRKYFDLSLMNQVDTNAIYEEFQNSYYKGFEKQPPILARLNLENPDRIYGVYRFYKNGCFSLFYLDRNEDNLTSEMFDPTISGWRGILYKKNEYLKGDMITQTGELSSMIGKSTCHFLFNGDTLFVTREESSNPKYATKIYIKRKISTNLLRHNADW